jgi:hypothetical protein
LQLCKLIRLKFCEFCEIGEDIGCLEGVEGHPLLPDEAETLRHAHPSLAQLCRGSLNGKQAAGLL